MASLSPPEPEWIDLRATDEPRLSAPPFFRISGATMLGCMTGGILGISYGGQNAALRFRAENAHRLPTTSKGWYFYHKSKNYKVMYGGIKEGFRMGAKIGFWVGSFFALETIIDNGREGRKDFVSTTGAGLATAGAFSLWNHLPLITAARNAKLGLLSGLGYGLLQDALSLAKGRRLAYVDWIMGRSRDNF